MVRHPQNNVHKTVLITLLKDAVIMNASESTFLVLSEMHSYHLNAFSLRLLIWCSHTKQTFGFKITLF